MDVSGTASEKAEAASDDNANNDDDNASNNGNEDDYVDDDDGDADNDDDGDDDRKKLSGRFEIWRGLSNELFSAIKVTALSVSKKFRCS